MTLSLGDRRAKERLATIIADRTVKGDGRLPHFGENLVPTGGISEKSGTPQCTDSFRSTTIETEANSERISLTTCLARRYFIRPFWPSRRGRTHFGQSAAHSASIVPRLVY